MRSLAEGFNLSGPAAYRYLSAAVIRCAIDDLETSLRDDAERFLFGPDVIPFAEILDRPVEEIRDLARRTLCPQQ